MATEALQDRLKEIAFMLETTPGTYIGDGSLFVAANAQHFVIDPRMEWSPEHVSRSDLKRGSMTPLQDVPGLKHGKLRFGIELTGPSSGTPNWTKFLRACGLHQVTCRAIGIGAVTNGPIAHGTIVAVTSTGDVDKNIRLRVLHELRDGQTHLRYERVSNTGSIVNGDKIKDATLATTYCVAASSDAQIGLTWYPVSFSTYSVDLDNFSGDFAVGDIITSVLEPTFIGIVEEATDDTNNRVLLRYRHLAGNNLVENDDITDGTNTADVDGTPAVDMTPSASAACLNDGVAEIIKGAHGTIVMGGEVGKRFLMTFEFDGAYEDVQDQGNLRPTTFPLLVPPTLLSTSFTIGDEDSYPDESTVFTPIVKSIELSLNNEIGMRTDMNEASGIIKANRSGRAPSCTVVFESVLEQTFNIMDKLMEAELFRFEFQVGTANGNRFIITCPGAQPIAVDPDEDGGVFLRNVRCNLTSGSQSPGQGENELVMTYESAALPT